LINGSIYIFFVVLGDPMFQPNVYFTYVFIFCAAFVNLSRLSSGYISALEYGDDQTRKVVSVAMVILDGLMTILATSIFYFTRSITVHLSCVVLMASFALFVTMFFAPETPSFLYTQKDYAKLEDCYRLMASYNKVEHSEELLQVCLQKLKDNQELNE